MNILVRLPNWMGDAIMATPLLEQLLTHYPDAKITLVGSALSCALFERDSRIARIIVDDSKKHFSRLLGLYRLAKTVGKHDLSFTLQNSLLSALFLYWSGSVIRIGYQNEQRTLLLTHAPKKQKELHQVRRYVHLLESYLQAELPVTPLKLCASPIPRQKPTLGINPGATYGSAKRWYPERFAEVARALGDQYDIVLFGGSGETDITQEIHTLLQQQGIHNITNLAGQTSINDLIDQIASLSLFITNDSGPMHIAAAFQIPTIAIFGPTDHTETSPWENPNSRIVRKEMPCAPCKKRTCPLRHHECMQLLESTDVLNAASAFVKIS